MKTNEEYAGTGFLKPEMYQVWADYFRKFLDVYEDQGIDFWGITTGNEPSLAIFSFMGINSVGWFPWTMVSVTYSDVCIAIFSYFTKFV